MLIHPDPDASALAPTMIWMHGRTSNKETDPGRYLRLIRAGIAVVAIDLPGHGQRASEALQSPYAVLDVVLQAVEEIDPLLIALQEYQGFDLSRIGIGGISAGGMVSLSRLTSPHPFKCCSVEATTGAWRFQQRRPNLSERGHQEFHHRNPMEHLSTWRPIPLQAQHSRFDQWVDYQGQKAFLDAIGRETRRPDLIELTTYGRTGAPQEHSGFGRRAAVAKDRQRDFLAHWLLGLDRQRAPQSDESDLQSENPATNT